MNHARLAVYVSQLADDLVRDFGLARGTADRIACRVELDVTKAQLASQDAALFLREYRAMGVVALSEATGCHRDTLRRRFNAANAENSPKHFGT